VPVPVPESVVGDEVRDDVGDNRGDDGGDGIKLVVKAFGYVGDCFDRVEEVLGYVVVDVAGMESGPVVWADFISLHTIYCICRTQTYQPRSAPKSNTDCLSTTAK
jgi:hypothetical protein